MRNTLMRRKVIVLSHIINLLVIEIILQLGNAILQNLGVKDEVDDVEIFLKYLPTFL